MIYKNLLAALTVSTGFIVCGCGSPEKQAPDMAALKVEIQEMENAFSAAEKAKDADAVAAYYSDDAISYGRDKAPAVGKEAIKESIATGLAKDTVGMTNVYEVVDLFAEGNMLVEIGSWKQIAPSGAVDKQGYYMSYFDKKNGKYQCVRDMNVSVNPASETN